MKHAAASILLMTSLLLSCRSPEASSPQQPARPQLALGMPLADLGDALRTAPAVPALPPRHRFTLMDQQGREMLGISVVCSADDYLFVFVDRELKKIVGMPQGVWTRRPDRGYVYEPPDEARLPEHARSTPSYSIDEWRERCGRREMESQDARAKYLDPLPILNLFPKEDDADKRKISLALMARFDATKLRLGGSARDAGGIFGVAPREVPQADGSQIDIYETTERAGWYAIPAVWVYSRNDRISEVWTKYTSEYH